jgi:hypothetical protein
VLFDELVNTGVRQIDYSNARNSDTKAGFTIAREALSKDYALAIARRSAQSTLGRMARWARRHQGLELRPGFGTLA